MQLAFPQILDLLGDQLDIETIGAGSPAAQQFRLFLGPGVEIVVVQRAVCVSHVCEPTTETPLGG